MSRAEAIRKLKNSKKLDDSLCLVDGQKIKIEERNILLEQLESNKVYLEVPIELYLVSSFWRNLKIESNKEVRQATR